MVAVKKYLFRLLPPPPSHTNYRLFVGSTTLSKDRTSGYPLIHRLACARTDTSIIIFVTVFLVNIIAHAFQTLNIRIQMEQQSSHGCSTHTITDNNTRNNNKAKVAADDTTSIVSQSRDPMVTDKAQATQLSSPSHPTPTHRLHLLPSQPPQRPSLLFRCFFLKKKESITRVPLTLRHSI